MHAVVLVGGFGTRLRPLTLDIPKPMLPVGHVPMIARLIDRLARGGVTDVVLSLGFKPEPFRAEFPDNRCGDVRLTYAVEPEPLDTGGAIRFAADHAGIDEMFVVANGDVMTDLDVAALVEAHRRHDAEATLHLIAVDDPSSFGVVDIDADGRILSFVEKPPPGSQPSNLINAGTYVFDPSMIERIPVATSVSIERDVFPGVATDGRLFGVATDDYWLDAGRPEMYLRANLDLLAGVRRFESCESVAGTAVVDSSALLERSIVGDRAVVGAGAHLVDSVLLAGARVGAGAVVRDSMVMGVVGADAEVTGCMIGAEGAVADGEQLTKTSRP